MSIFKLHIDTYQKEELINITSQIDNYIKKNNISNGYVALFVPHTTAAVTINENTDPDVLSDMLKGLKDAFPNKEEYDHFEQNSDAHIKSSIIGASEYIFIQNGELVLGTWQGIYFCEFDGPKRRKLLIKIIED